jgi:DNA repair exonuclease SbcCD ATPase subunit
MSEMKEKVQALLEQETQFKEAQEAANKEINDLKKGKEEQKEAETQKKKKDLGQAKLKAVILELKRKLEKVEKLRQKEAKDLSNAESSLRSETLKSQELEQASTHEIQRLESELKTYKARAHILLQQKEDQLKNTVSTEMANTYKDKVSSLEEEVEELLGSRKQMEQAYTELQECHATEMKDLLESHKTEIAMRDENIVEKNQEVMEIEERLDQELGNQLEKLNQTEKERDQLQSKCSALEEEYQSDKTTYQDIKDLHDTLEKEYKMYKQTAEELMHEKDKNISELSASLRDNKTLAMYKEAAKPLAVEDPRPAEIPVSSAPTDNSPHEEKMQNNSGTFSLENDLLGDITNSNIVEAAKLQASRDAFLQEYVQRIAELENEIQELQKEIAMREHLESVLKEELRKKEREEARSNLKGKDYDMEYLKNIVLKLLETGEYEVLLPVIATLLSLSPDEVGRIQKAYKEGVHSQANDPMEYATKTASDVTSYLSGWMFSGSGSSSK